MWWDARPRWSWGHLCLVSFHHGKAGQSTAETWKFATLDMRRILDQHSENSKKLQVCHVQNNGKFQIQTCCEGSRHGTSVRHGFPKFQGHSESRALRDMRVLGPPTPPRFRGEDVAVWFRSHEDHVGSFWITPKGTMSWWMENFWINRTHSKWKGRFMDDSSMIPFWMMMFYVPFFSKMGSYWNPKWDQKMMLIPFYVLYCVFLFFFHIKFVYWFFIHIKCFIP